MSQENVELVVSAIERWNCGDDAGALGSFAPDVEVHHNIGRGTPLEGVYHGHTEVRKLWSDIRDSFAEARFDIDRATEHDGVALVLGTLRLRGTGSGAAADTPLGLSPSSSTDWEDASSSGPATNPAPSRPWGCRSSQPTGFPRFRNPPARSRSF